MCIRHNVCRVLIKIHYVDFDQLQTRHYEQRNKRSWETISIAGNEWEENCEIGNAFQNKYLNRSRKQWYRATTSLRFRLKNVEDG